VSEKDRRSRAVALGYDAAQDRAPRVLAKGSGALAQKIIAIANEHGIPLQEDPVLVELLAQIDVDREIPPELYKAVAEILAFVYRLKQDRP
jgi:flagellar biosynthesis protein